MLQAVAEQVVRGFFVHAVQFIIESSDAQSQRRGPFSEM
jgi:hypothetical protein